MSVKHATILLGGLATGLSLPVHALKPEINLAGTFAMSLSQFESDLGGQDLDLENNGSNFGITAAAKAAGLRAFAVYERGANNDGAAEGVREFYGGLDTEYGTLVYGRKATDYRAAGERLDPFYDTSVAGYTGQFASEGGGFGLSNLTNGFTSNTVAYRSRVFGGTTFNAAAYINDQPEPNDKHDFGAGFTWAGNDWGLDAGVQYLSLNALPIFPGSGVANTPGPGSALRVHGTWVRSRWAVGGSYESIDVDLEADPRQYAFVAGSFQFTEALRIAASFGSARDTPFDGTGGVVGGIYDVMPGLSAYVAARVVALDSGDDTTVLAAGARFTFDADL